MRKFKVISLAVSGKANKIFRTHDVVEERQVHDADDLVKRKHLIEIIEDEPPVEDSQEQLPSPSNDDQNDSRETSESTVVESNNVTDPESLDNTLDITSIEKPALDEIETADIKKQLKERGVTFNKNASKEELYRLFIGL